MKLSTRKWPRTGIDVDKPEGFVKRHLRRQWRRLIARMTVADYERVTREGGK